MILCLGANRTGIFVGGAKKGLSAAIAEGKKPLTTRGSGGAS